VTRALLVAAGLWAAAAPASGTGGGSTVVETTTTESADAKAVPPAEGGPTYYVEYVQRTAKNAERVTLFADGVLVRKTTTDGKVDMKKRKLAPAELQSYVAVFRAPDVEEAAGTFESGMSGDELPHFRITVTKSDGHTWTIVFDALAALTPEAQRIRAAMEDLRDSFGKPHAAPGDFPPDKLVPGTILRRRDGAEFRIVHFDEHAGIVELKGLDEPYSQFFKLDRLAASFLPP
jgi:hypothetical protein